MPQSNNGRACSPNAPGAGKKAESHMEDGICCSPMYYSVHESFHAARSANAPCRDGLMRFCEKLGCTIYKYSKKTKPVATPSRQAGGTGGTGGLARPIADEKPMEGKSHALPWQEDGRGCPSPSTLSHHKAAGRLGRVDHAERKSLDEVVADGGPCRRVCGCYSARGCRDCGWGGMNLLGGRW